MKLSGIFVSLVTPFDHRGSIYVSKMHHNIELMNQTNVSGYIVGGAAGEGALLSSEERIALWECAAATAGGRHVIPAVGAASVHETLELISRASGIGFESALIELPVGSSLDLTDARTQALFGRSVADRSPLPLVISSEADQRGRLCPELMASLGRHRQVAGLRVVTDDAAYFNACLQAGHNEADLIVGCASLLAEGLIDGASAAMISFASVVPYLCLSIDEAVRTREFDAATDLQGVATPAIDTIRKYGVPGLKVAVDMQGYYGGIPRLPLAPLVPAARAEIQAVLRHINS